ncbi:MAG: hypoxanthine phosphoribosyltransferase [Acidimicrobiia bacterium]|nr:hypoxanthine phosphoribosyltransferase [Acidimicrobiia bacterium]
MKDSNGKIGNILVAEEEIKAKLIEMGNAIATDYEGKSPLMIGVLKGAFIFMADLIRAIPIDCEVDFMAVSSYGAATKSSGVVRIIKDLDTDLTDRHVILVEDIIDSGLTLSYLRKNLLARKPASLEICAMFIKKDLQKAKIECKYEGFFIPPDFVVGYGLDARENLRGLKYLAEYKD